VWVTINKKLFRGPPMVSSRTIVGYGNKSVSKSEESSGQKNRRLNFTTFFTTWPLGLWQSLNKNKEISNYLFHPSWARKTYATVRYSAILLS
jgi:hypothetical protein